MKKMLLIMMIPLLMVSCNAQTKEKKKNEAPQQVSKKEMNHNMPKVDIKVDKVYDNKGNLVGYDSTYVWSYTNNQGDSVSLDIDSVISRFKPIVNARYPGFLNNYDKMFFNDSLFYHDFLYPDYFMNRWEKNMGRMNRTMKEMDSLKNLFFREQFPELKKEKPRK